MRATSLSGTERSKPPDATPTSERIPVALVQLELDFFHVGGHVLREKLAVSHSAPRRGADGAGAPRTAADALGPYLVPVGLHVNRPLMRVPVLLPLLPEVPRHVPVHYRLHDGDALARERREAAAARSAPVSAAAPEPAAQSSPSAARSEPRGAARGTSHGERERCSHGRAGRRRSPRGSGALQTPHRFEVEGESRAASSGPR